MLNFWCVSYKIAACLYLKKKKTTIINTHMLIVVYLEFEFWGFIFWGWGLGLFFQLKPERISKINVKLDSLFIYHRPYRLDHGCHLKVKIVFNTKHNLKLNFSFLFLFVSSLFMKSNWKWSSKISCKSMDLIRTLFDLFSKPE